MELDRVVIEVDTKIVVDAVNSSKQDISIFGDNITKCRVLLIECSNFSVSFIYRNVIKLTHRLARMSRNLSSSSFWVEPPNVVDNLLEDFCTCSI